MRRYIFFLAIFILLFVDAAGLAQDEKARDPLRVYQKANSYYEKGDYTKAVEGYLMILDMGYESGVLYYNIGNGFFKLGKLGYAILCYKKAKRLIPGDGDLKSNFAYAESLIEDVSSEPQKNFIIRAVEMPFESFSLSTTIVIATVLYLIVVIASAIYILNPFVLRRFKAVFLIALVAFLISLSATAMRYYDEEILKHGLVMQKEVDCKFEPIEKSTTHYKLYEGNEVLILQRKNSWVKIKRLDGKIAWVKTEAVEII